MRNSPAWHKNDTLKAYRKNKNGQRTTLVEMQKRLDRLQRINKRLSFTLKRQQRDGKQFRTLFDNQNESILLVDPENKQIIDSNPRAAQMLGYTREEMKNMPIEQVHPNDLEQVMEFAESVLTSGSCWTDSLQCRHKDGTLLESEVSGSVFEMCGRKVMIAQVRDISMIKRLEKERDQSEAKFKSLVDVMNEGLIMVDNEDRIQYVNKKFCELVGYKESHLLGKVAHEMPWVEVEADVIKSRIEERKKGNSGSYELPYVNKYGEKKWVQVSGAPVHDEQGLVVGSIAVNTDITELKRAQRTLKSKNEELATLLYRISHDLRAPVCSLLGLIELVKREEKYGECLAQIEMMGGCAENLDSILHDLFEILQITHKEIVTKPIEVRSMVMVVIKSLENLPNFKHVNFKIKIPKDLRYTGDVLSFRSIVQNLLSNSVNYCDWQTRMPVVNVTAHHVNSIVNINISDNGKGIQKIEQPKVFDMFYRSSPNSMGTGLGLYIVSKSVEKLGGTVKLTSEFRKGTDVTIVLPETNKNSR